MQSGGRQPVDQFVIADKTNPECPTGRFLKCPACKSVHTTGRQSRERRTWLQTPTNFADGQRWIRQEKQAAKEIYPAPRRGFEWKMLCVTLQKSNARIPHVPSCTVEDLPIDVEGRDATWPMGVKEAGM